MQVVVPSAVAQVDAAKVGNTLIYNDELLVVSPHDCEELVGFVYVIRVAQNFYILM